MAFLESCADIVVSALADVPTFFNINLAIHRLFPPVLASLLFLASLLLPVVFCAGVVIINIVLSSRNVVKSTPVRGNLSE